MKIATYKLGILDEVPDCAPFLSVFMHAGTLQKSDMYVMIQRGQYRIPISIQM